MEVSNGDLTAMSQTPSYHSLGHNPKTFQIIHVTNKYLDQFPDSENVSMNNATRDMDAHVFMRKEQLSSNHLPSLTPKVTRLNLSVIG